MHRPMGRYRRRNIWKLHFLQCSNFSYTAILGHSPCDGYNPVRVRQCHERIRLLLRYHAKPFQATRWTVVDRSERDGTVHGAQLPEDYGRAVADQLRPPLPTLGNSSSHTWTLVDNKPRPNSDKGKEHRIGILYHPRRKIKNSFPIFSSSTFKCGGHIIEISMRENQTHLSYLQNSTLICFLKLFQAIPRNWNHIFSETLNHENHTVSNSNVQKL